VLGAALERPPPRTPNYSSSLPPSECMIHHEAQAESHDGRAILAETPVGP
jgi:hypothetical protein